MAPTPNKKKILIIDDDEPTRRVYERALAHAGFDVELAHDGWDGYQKALHGSPDAVVLDLMMPQMDGIGFLQALRTSSAADVPVVVVSALRDDEKSARCTALGVKEQFIKTRFDLKDLIAALTRHAGA